MSNKAEFLPRARNDIAGLDAVRGGGWARNRLHLLGGSPGTGKTTIALQFLMAGAEEGEAGIYVSLAKTEQELRDGAKSYGWSISPLIFELAPPESVLDPDQQQSLLYSSDLAFEPFFTAKEIGKGSGLGLSQVLGFAKQSGGGVRIQSEAGQGTTIEIFLPRADVRPVKIDPAPPRPTFTAKGSARLLLVDDDNAVREVTAVTLRELGYTVLEAGSGGAALELLERSANIDLMLIDFAMPGMSGAEVARRVQTTRPALPILFVTGYAGGAALEGVSEAQIIGKPFVDTELHEKVRTALAPGTRQSGAPQTLLRQPEQTSFLDVTSSLRRSK